ncbi:MAG: ABC transporter substrate-binding protein [Clostridia bacterium]|nr:ABC transporter substrate-binding protein [Clostridia bacterium]
MKKVLGFMCAVLLTSATAISVGGCALAGGGEEPYGVATCSVAICEILDALGCEDVVGVPATSDTLPERYEKVKTVGAPMEPQMEILKQINPETVLVPKTLEASLSAEFAAAKIEVKYVDLSDIDEMYNDILEIGELVGKREAAQELYDGYGQYMDAYPKSETEISVMTVMAFSNLFTIATEDSYVGNLVKLAGGKNVYGTGLVTDGTGVITNYSLEDMAQKDPDIILVFAHFNEEYAFKYIEDLTRTDAVWKNFSAVSDNKVYYLSTNDGFGVSANLDWTKALETLRPIFFGE